MSTFFERWHQWWLGPIDPRPLAFVRISLGLFFIVYGLTFLPFTTLLFSNQGLVLPLLAHGAPEWLQWLLQPPSAAVAWCVMVIYFVCVIGITIGYKLRWCLLGTIVIALWTWQLQLHLFPGSYSRLLLFTLIVLLLGGADHAWAHRMKREQGSAWASKPMHAVAQRLLMVQLTITYAGVGLQKLVLPIWATGEVLSYSLSGLWASPLAFWFIGLNLPMSAYDFFIWVVIVFEVTIPIGLWIPSVQRYFMLGGAIFHILIAIMLGIWWFVVLIPLYVLFLPPTQFSGLVQQCSRRLGILRT